MDDKAHSGEVSEVRSRLLVTGVFVKRTQMNVLQCLEEEKIVKDETGYLTKEISKPNIAGAFWILLTAYSKTMRYKR